MNAFELTTLIDTAFPNMLCVRCSHSEFYLMPSQPTGPMPETVSVACRRCGFIEQHLVGLLQQANKPIVSGGSK
jgi:predicted nucleic-acid-binding Zn-ribbon protein